MQEKILNGKKNGLAMLFLILLLYVVGIAVLVAGGVMAEAGTLMPLAVLVDGKLKRENESLNDFVCENVVGSKPLVCRERDPIPPRQLEHDVKMDIYLNIYCTANEPVLSPFMQWVTSDPE